MQDALCASDHARCQRSLHPRLSVAARLLQASLDSLNGVLEKGQAVPMHRFRPNVVVSGTQAFEEDDWDTFTVSAPSHAPCKFKSVMPCDRCKVCLSQSVLQGSSRGAE